MKKYNIVRMYFNDNQWIAQRIVKKGLTLEEAQSHCQDDETSSSTCTKSAGKARTKRFGAWFDGYDSQ